MKKNLVKQNPLYQRIRDIVEASRGRALYAVNAEMVRACWLMAKDLQKRI